MKSLLKQSTSKGQAMKSAAALSLQATFFATVGASCGYYFGMSLPPQTTAEMIQALGNISVIAGSLVGWSVGWIAQSRGLIRDIDYNSAIAVFRQLGELQIEIIWRWLIVFSCSVVAVTCSVIMKMPKLNTESYCGMLVISSGLLGVALAFILYLFQRMLALASLKSQLDEFERDQLRKSRLLPRSQTNQSSHSRTSDG